MWCSLEHPHNECTLFQNRNKDASKCANCGGTHPAWSHECDHYRKAAQASAKSTAARIVGSSSINEGTLTAAINDIKESIVLVVAEVVSRAILKTREDEARSRESREKVPPRDIVLLISRDTVEAMNRRQTLSAGKPLVVAEIERKVWKGIHPQDEIPLSSQATASPQVGVNLKGTGSHVR